MPTKSKLFTLEEYVNEYGSYVRCPSLVTYRKVVERALALGAIWKDSNATTPDRGFTNYRNSVRKTSVYILLHSTRGTTIAAAPAYSDDSTAKEFLSKTLDKKVTIKELVKKLKVMPDNVQAQPEAKPKKKQVRLEVSRKDGKTVLKFEIDKTLETIFENHSGGEKRTSESWKGLEFYYYPEIIDSEQYKQLLNQYNLFDDYGHPFVRGDRYFNIAFLRTVGGKGEVTLKDDISFAAVSQGLKSMTRFIKEFYEEFLSDYKVSAVINIEI